MIAAVFGSLTVLCVVVGIMDHTLTCLHVWPGKKAAGSNDGVVPAVSAAGVDRESNKLPLPENGFWQAAEVLFSQREAPNLVGR